MPGNGKEGLWAVTYCEFLLQILHGIEPKWPEMCLPVCVSLPPPLQPECSIEDGWGWGCREAVCNEGEAGVAVKEVEGTSGSIWSDSWFRAKRNHRQML